MYTVMLHSKKDIIYIHTSADLQYFKSTIKSCLKKDINLGVQGKPTLKEL